MLLRLAGPGVGPLTKRVSLPPPRELEEEERELGWGGRGSGGGGNEGQGMHMASYYTLSLFFSNGERHSVTDLSCQPQRLMEKQNQVKEGVEAGLVIGDEG